tara:strand:+ start:4041 stop:4952 length:912 start_codon:yes stop_codon:yes gene_type:complete
MSEKIQIIEVGPRDGLQNEKKPIPLGMKYRFVENLLGAGIDNIEVSSFVRADRIPQLSDAAELFQMIYNNKLAGNFSALIPNVKGLNRAIECRANRFAVFTASSETFNKKNINSTIEESLHLIGEVLAEAKKTSTSVRGYVSTAFGCPYEGKTKGNEDKVIEICEKLFDWGVDEISIGDTIGVGNPNQVKSLIKRLEKKWDLSRFAMHFHDTYSRALGNVMTSIEYGIRKFDSSAGGLGGCPYAHGATGNLATEDLVHLLHDLGFETGVDLYKLKNSSSEIFEFLGKTSSSKVHHAIGDSCGK